MSKVVKKGKLYVNNKNPLEKNNESSLDKQEGFDVMTNNYTSGGNTNTYSAGNSENGEISIKNRADYKELKELQTTYDRQLQEYNQAIKTLIEESRGYITASNRNNNRFANTYLKDAGGAVGYVTDRGVWKHLPNPQMANSMQGKNGCPLNWANAQTIKPDDGQSSIADAPEGKMINIQGGVSLIKGTDTILNQSCTSAGQNIYITNPGRTANRKYVQCSQNSGIFQSDLGSTTIDACAKRAEDMGSNVFQMGPNNGGGRGNCYINGGGNPLNAQLCPNVPGTGQMGVVQPGSYVQSNQGGWWWWWNWSPPTWVPGYNGFATYQTTGASNANLGQTYYITDDLTKKQYPSNMITGYGNDFQLLSGYNSYGNDITSGSGLSLEQVKQKCLATPGAAGFYINGNNYWIKNANMWPKGNRQYTGGDLYIRNIKVNNNNSCSKQVNFSQQNDIDGYANAGFIDMNTTCGLGTISARDTQLIKIQYDKLNALLDKIYQKIVDLSKEDVKLNERLLGEYNSLKSKLNKYESTYKEIRVGKEAVPQNDAMAEDSNLQMLSYNKKYILWSMVALGVTVGAMNVMK